MLSFRALTKRFGAQRAVESLTLDVARGEVVALLGPSGAGKTTALKAAAGLILPTSGEVMLGDPPRPAHEPAARRILSYLPQKASFPDALTGREVVEFYRELRDAPAERSPKVLRFAALDRVGERAVGTYSGGMVRRLGLAVAMLPEAPVLLLDEPTAKLDPDGLGAFYGLVEAARQDGRAILFTSQELGDAERLADRFAVLVGGRLVASLTAAQLKDRLSERGVMRLRLASRPQGLLSAVRELVPGAVWEGEARAWRPWPGEELVVPGPAAVRSRVLDTMRAFPVELRGYTAEEGRPDALYRELVGQAEARSVQAGAA